MRRIAHIHPDYSLGRNVFDHFSVAMAKLVPRAQVVSESWPKLGSTVFTADVAKTMAATPDLVVTSVWGGNYVILYRQALAAGMFSRTKLATANGVRCDASRDRSGPSRGRAPSPRRSRDRGRSSASIMHSSSATRRIARSGRSGRRWPTPEPWPICCDVTMALAFDC